MYGLRMRSRKKSKKFLETNENEHTTAKNLQGHSEGSPEREVHSKTSLPKKDTKFSNKQSNPTSRTGGTTTNKAQS